MSKKWASLVLLALKGRRGAAMVEYALLAALIAVVAVASASAIGTNINSSFGAIATALGPNNAIRRPTPVPMPVAPAAMSAGAAVANSPAATQ